MAIANTSRYGCRLDVLKVVVVVAVVRFFTDRLIAYSGRHLLAVQPL